MTDDDLRLVVAPYGPALSVKVVIDRSNGLCKGKLLTIRHTY